MKTYTYPDGSQSFVQPKDGATFYLPDLGSTNSTKSEWVWDGMYEKWVKKNTILNNGQPAIWKRAGDCVQVNLENAVAINATLSCECGAHKVKDCRHANWCPQFKD